MSFILFFGNAKKFIRQLHYRFRTDSGVVDATPTWGANDDQTYYAGSSTFRLRFVIGNEGLPFNDTFQLRVSVNEGSYNLVTTSSSPVRSVDAGSSADETAITIPRLIQS